MKQRIGQLYVLSIALLSLITLVYVYVLPPLSTQMSADGVLHFSPPVVNPDTGDAIDLDTLVRHYRGD